MHTVMVHIDATLGPIGAWGFHEEELTHFYPQSLDVHISARGRVAMAARPEHLTVPEWFALLASKPFAIDQYETVQLDGDVNLAEVVLEFRKQWKEHAL